MFSFQGFQTAKTPRLQKNSYFINKGSIKSILNFSQKNSYFINKGSIKSILNFPAHSKEFIFKWKYF